MNKDNDLKNIRFEYEDVARENIDQQENTLPKRINKRTLIIILTIFCLIVFSVAIVSIVSNALNKVSEIEVSDAGEYTKEEIISVSKIRYGDQINKIDIQLAVKNLEENYPLINTIKIDVSKRGKVIINIIWSKRTYKLKILEKWTILSKELKVIENNASDVVENLTEIKSGTILRAVRGEKIIFRNEEDEKILNSLIKSLDKNGLMDRTTMIKTDDVYNLEIEVESLYLVKLGNAEMLDSKASFVCETLKDKRFDGTKKATLVVSEDIKNISVVFE